MEAQIMKGKKKKIWHFENIINLLYYACKLLLWKHKMENDKQTGLNPSKRLYVRPEAVNYIHTGLSGHFNVSFFLEEKPWDTRTHRHTHTCKEEKNKSHTLCFTLCPSHLLLFKRWNPALRHYCQPPPPTHPINLPQPFTSPPLST